LTFHARQLGRSLGWPATCNWFRFREVVDGARGARPAPAKAVARQHLQRLPEILQGTCGSLLVILIGPAGTIVCC
jgi:hypothetical protein